MLPEITTQELADAVDRVATETLWEAGIEAPPVNAFLLAEALGMPVAIDTTMPGRARVVRLARQSESCVCGLEANSPNEPWQPGTSTIFLADDPRPERRHWAVAHEVGEVLTHRVFTALGISPQEIAPNSREQIANRLANSLLLPRRWFAGDLQELEFDLWELKSRYTTASHELIARRWLELSKWPIVVTVFDHGEITWRRTNFTASRYPITPEERGCWQAAYESGEPTLLEAPQLRCPADYQIQGLSQIRCWPIHETKDERLWRREILLSEVAEGW